MQLFIVEAVIGNPAVPFVYKKIGILADASNWALDLSFGGEKKLHAYRLLHVNLLGGKIPFGSHSVPSETPDEVLYGRRLS